jgi:C4-dicarboxylate-specific signal transduction histidine kinase
MKFFGLDADMDDSAELSKALRDAQERLAQASRRTAVAELSASVAHELNQPLQAIVAHGRASVRWLVATPPWIEEAKYSAEQVLRDANSAADVVSRIRALFRHTVPQKIDLDINKLILQVCTLMADDIQRNAISLETILGEDVSRIGADAVQIQQVMVNLVRNAIEALAATEERPIFHHEGNRDGHGLGNLPFHHRSTRWSDLGRAQYIPRRNLPLRTSDRRLDRNSTLTTAVSVASRLQHNMVGQRVRLL